MAEHEDTFAESPSDEVSILSHELRNPLAIARWHTELSLGGTHGEINNPQVVASLEKTHAALLRLDQALGVFFKMRGFDR